jgi:hypothetical protein
VFDFRQPGRPSFRRVRRPLLVLLLTAIACAHPAYGASDEDRLAEAVAGTNGQPKAQIQGCEDQQEILGKGRNIERNESERLRSYMDVVHSLAERVEQNRKLVAEDPDIAYAGGSGTKSATEARQQLDACRELYGDAKREFDELVHELFTPILVLDVGKRTRSARVSLPLLRSAVEELQPGDADALRDKLNEAERVLQGQRKSGG